MLQIQKTLITLWIATVVIVASQFISPETPPPMPELYQSQSLEYLVESDSIRPPPPPLNRRWHRAHLKRAAAALFN